MGLSPGAGTSVVLSAVIFFAGVFTLVIATDSSMGVVGWVLIAVGALFVAFNLILLRRGR